LLSGTVERLAIACNTSFRATKHGREVRNGERHVRWIAVGTHAILA
jgi:hypothetical protein